MHYRARPRPSLFWVLYLRNKRIKGVRSLNQTMPSIPPIFVVLTLSAVSWEEIKKIRNKRKKAYRSLEEKKKKIRENVQKKRKTKKLCQRWNDDPELQMSGDIRRGMEMINSQIYPKATPSVLAMSSGYTRILKGSTLRRRGRIFGGPRLGAYMRTTDSIE
jgi:hypothetical protein